MSCQKRAADDCKGAVQNLALAFPVGISGHGIGTSGHGISGTSIFKLSFKIILFLIISLSEFEGNFEILFYFVLK